MSKQLDDPFENLDDLFGEPPLLKSEDMEQYRSIEKEVGRALQPKSLFEALHARDIAMAAWEERRFKEHASALLDVERPKALKKLIDPKSGYVAETKKAVKSIEDYRANPNSSSESILLKTLGIASVAVEAHALLLAAENFLALDGLVAKRNAARKIGLKDYRRQQELDAKRKREAIKAKLKRSKEKAQKKKSDWDE